MDIPRAPSRSRRLRPHIIGGGVLLAAVVLIALARVGPAMPSISVDRLVIDQVVRGDLVRSVSGPGRLSPEDQQLIPAPASGRVQERLVEAGARVAPGDALLVLANPEVDLRLLEAERVLAEAKMARQRLVSGNDTGLLAKERELAGLEAQLHEAERQHQAMSALLAEGLVSEIEASGASSRWLELAAQVRLVKQQSTLMTTTFQADLKGQDEELRRVARVAAFHRQRVDSLTVRSSIAGVVQEISLEQGQWVSSGELLARVFRPGELKAELRVPEARAGEISPGQRTLVTIRGDSIAGVVRRVDPAAVGGTVLVEIRLLGDLPASARPDLNVEGHIETGRIADTLHLRRPVGAVPGRKTWLYRLAGEGRAERVAVVFGEGSTERIALVEGAKAGDRLIVSSFAGSGEAPRLRILD